MHAKLVAETDGERTFVLVLDTGEEAFAVITEFAARRGLHGASLTAIGAFESAQLGWFDFDRKVYKPIAVGEQCEVLSLIGDIALGDDGKPSLHAHAVLGLANGVTRGGHLMKGLVRPTLEVTIVETPAHLRRKKRPELGIALIELG